MAHEPRFVWHTHPNFHGIRTPNLDFWWGGGGGFRYRYRRNITDEVCICNGDYLDFKAESASVTKDLLLLELFAMGPVQFSRPRGVAKNWLAELDFGEHFVSFS